MSHDLNLYLHIIESQLLHSNPSQQRLMIRAVFSKIADNMQIRFFIHCCKVTADFIDLLPTFSAGLLQSVFDVCKGLVDLFA